MANLLGMINGKYIGNLPAWVDPSLPPGFTPIPRYTVSKWLSGFIALKPLYADANATFLIIAILGYVLFPYDLSPNSLAASSPLSLRHFCHRFPVWMLLTFGWSTFWHVSLCGFKLASRPFVEMRQYKVSKVIHNVFWSLNGVIIFTIFDCVMSHLWATNKIPYLPDKRAFSSLSGILQFVLGIMVVPIFRDMHFYWGHRLLHHPPLFQQVHSLHHRNTDIEPFAGLSMHPIEHLYYYTSILPSLILPLSPFSFFYNGAHLLLAPSASHSGWEDQFQSDSFHYMHHRYFECNFAGTSVSWLDQYFGTFCGQFKEKIQPRQVVDQHGNQVTVKGILPREDAKAVLGLPTKDFLLYLTVNSLIFLGWGYIVVSKVTCSNLEAALLAFACGFGPVIIACLMSAYQRRSFAVILQSQFQKTPLWHVLVHLLIGTLFCSVPIYYMVYLTLVDRPAHA